MTESIVYFEKKGRENTAKTIELAVREAKRLGIKKLVVASNAGGTALQIPEDCGLDVTVVSYAYGQKEPGNHPMTEETRKALNDRDTILSTPPTPSAASSAVCPTPSAAFIPSR